MRTLAFLILSLVTVPCFGQYRAPFNYYRSQNVGRSTYYYSNNGRIIGRSYNTGRSRYFNRGGRVTDRFYRTRNSTYNFRNRSER